jgi:hypothetical protein
MDPVSDGDGALDAFTAAAIDWAAGGRGQPLVDAAANALAAGLASPTLRVLAGASHGSADEEASDLAPTVFTELGLDVRERLSTEAKIEGARQQAARFLSGQGSARELARELGGMYASAGYPEELNTWSGIDDWYDMLEGKVISGDLRDADAAVVDAARALVAGTPTDPITLGSIFVGGRASRRRRLRLPWRRST